MTWGSEEEEAWRFSGMDQAWPMLSGCLKIDVLSNQPGQAQMNSPVRTFTAEIVSAVAGLAWSSAGRT